MKYFSLLAVVLVISSAPAVADNLNFQFNNPNFGGFPDNGPFLFGLAEAQRTATTSSPPAGAAPGAGAPAIPGIGGTNVGGPTIVIPIGDLGPDAPGVEVEN